MSVPFYANLIIGGAFLFLLYRSGFRVENQADARFVKSGPIAAVEARAGAIALVTAFAVVSPTSPMDCIRRSRR